MNLKSKKYFPFNYSVKFLSTTLCYKFKYGSNEELNNLTSRLFMILQSKKDDGTLIDSLNGLSCTDDYSMLTTMLDLLLEFEIRDIFAHFMRFIITKPNGQSYAWNYIKLNWNKIVNM
jgi:hypothetical protein